MNEWTIFEKLSLTVSQIFSQLQQSLLTIDVWLQIIVIAAVFIIARWMLTPQFQRLIIKLSTASAKIASFHRLMVTLNEFANTLMWLMLQWIAIQILVFYQQPHQLLKPVASLLSAWLLIRIASKLLKNEMASRAVFVIAWSIALLSVFNLLNPTLDLLDSFAFNIGNIRVTPLLVIKAGLSLWLSLWLANVFSGFLDRRLESSGNVTPAMRVLSVKLLNVGLISAAFLITFSAVGIDLTAFAVFGGALGVGLGFGLQKIFSNLVSGVILLMDRSIKPGDVISVGGTVGWINHLSARYVSVITRDGIEILIPNETLVTDRVENWSFSDNLVRLRIPIGISYKADVNRAIDLCVEAANQTPRIVNQPEPRCLLIGFGDSSVNLELRVWINDPANGRANVISEILLKIWHLFKQNNIEIPFPQRDLHLVSMTESARQKLGK